MKLIPLSKTSMKNAGKYFAKVDDEDYDYLMQWNWSVTKIKNSFYAIRATWSVSEKKHSTISMHRAILWMIDDSLLIDHADTDGLNCQKYNLRAATYSQNRGNANKWAKASSAFKGITYIKRIDKWMASIKKGKKYCFLGYFKTEIEAAKAYDESAKEYFGKFAKPNFQ